MTSHRTRTALAPPAAKRSIRRLLGGVVAATAVLLAVAAPASAYTISVSPNPAEFGDVVTVELFSPPPCTFIADSSAAGIPDGGRGVYFVEWYRPDGTLAHREAVTAPPGVLNEISHQFQVPDAGPEGRYTIRFPGLRERCGGDVDVAPEGFDVVVQLEPIAAEGWGPLVLGSLVTAGGATVLLARRRRVRSLPA